MKIAINGFGRIGRMVLRAFIEDIVRFEHDSKRTIDIVAINDLSPIDTNIHLFTYDSVHGRFEGTVEKKDGFVCIYYKGREFLISCLSESSPSRLPWKDLKIDLVFECSGCFSRKEEASLHLMGGAKRVLVSGPCDRADKTIVYGVNHETMTRSDLVLSNASCTTNCLAPVASILLKSIGIELGFMTTIHSYTGDQRLIDTSHSDLRRARAANLSMIPSTTGAARALGLVLPELQGRLDGTSIRVPTANVSLIDFTFTVSQDTSVTEINQLIREASKTNLKDVLAYVDLPLVSVDFKHDPHSSIFDATQTQVVGKRFCRVLSWYDNEWGFSNRMLDVGLYIQQQGL